MGNNLSKFCRARTGDVGIRDSLDRETSVSAHSSPKGVKELDHVEARASADEDLNYPSLRGEQKEKLEEFYRYITANASVDFTQQEINDIQNATHTMLERLKSRVNERGIFKIARTLSSGSMNEKTSLWKYYEGDPYLEFDYLAVLENAIKQHEDQNKCRACVKLTNIPVDLQQLRKYYDNETLNANKLENKRAINELFLNEINKSLSSLCECLSLNIYNYETKDKKPSTDSPPPPGIGTILYVGGHYILFQQSPMRHGCEICTVKTPTGTVSVNTTVINEGAGVVPTIAL